MHNIARYIAYLTSVEPTAKKNKMGKNAPSDLSNEKALFIRDWDHPGNADIAGKSMKSFLR